MTPEQYIEACRAEYCQSPAEAYVLSRGHYDEDRGYFGYDPGLGPEGLRGRLILPIFHPYHGELVGISGRALDNTQPKYYNLPGLRKNRLLYGAARPEPIDKPVVLVEGQLDVWALEKIGLAAYALMGATCSGAAGRPAHLITPWQIGLLRRVCEHVIVWPDADLFAVTAEVWESDLKQYGFKVTKGSYPAEGGDPDTLCQTYPEKMKEFYARLCNTE